MRRTLALIAVLLLSLGLASAQQDTKPEKTAAAQTGQSAEMPNPSPEIQKLAKLFLGEFDVEGKILDENWAPGGDEGSGTETVKAGPGDFSVISDAQMKWSKLGPMTGHGVIWWNDAKKAYLALWCDSWGSCESAGEGKWSGEALVFEGPMMMGPQQVTVRQTYKGFSDKGYFWTMEASYGEGKWVPEMSLRYTRRGSR